MKQHSDKSETAAESGGDSLRRPELVAHGSSLIAVVTTILMVGTGAASESNPASAWIIEHGGMATWALLTPFLVASGFALFRAIARGSAFGIEFDGSERAARASAWILGVAFALDGIGNLIAMSILGVPESAPYGRLAGLAVALGVLVVSLIYRSEIVSVVRRALSSETARGIVTGLAVVLVITSGLGGIPLTQEYSAVQNASAAGTNVDDFEDGDVVEWSSWTKGGATTAKSFEGSWSGDLDAAGAKQTAAYNIGSEVAMDNMSFKVNSAEMSDAAYPLFQTRNSGGANVMHLEGSNGELIGRDGTTDISTGISIKDNTWYEIYAQFDYANNQYDVTVWNKSGGKVGSYAGLPFDNAASGMQEIKFHAYDFSTYIDDVEYNKPADGSTSDVSGTVTDGSGNALGGATVKTGTGKSTTTASDGTYTLTLSDGTYDITAEKAGYLSQTNTVSVSGSAVTGNDYSLNATVTGNVTDLDGNGISGATISDGSGNSTTTDATGYYSLPLVNDTYDLTASHVDYKNKTKSVTVSGAAEKVEYSLCDASGCPDPTEYKETFVVNDPEGRYLDHDPTLTLYQSTLDPANDPTMITQNALTSDSEFTEFDTGSINWEGNRTVTLNNDEYYKYVLESGNGEMLEVTGYRANKSDGPTMINISGDSYQTPEPLPDDDGDGTANYWDDDTDGDGTPDDNDPDWSPEPEPEPTLEFRGDCSVGGDPGIKIFYDDPTDSTYSFDYALENSSGVMYEGTVTPSSSAAPLGTYNGCVLDVATAGGSDDTNVTANWSARDDAGDVIASGSESNGGGSAPTFLPSGNAPESTGERVLLLVAVLAALGALWVGGRRYAPGDEIESWPLENVSPLFAVGTPIVVLIALDISGGGVISAAISFGVARAAPLAGIVGIGLGGYYLWNVIQPGDYKR